MRAASATLSTLVPLALTVATALGQDPPPDTQEPPPDPEEEVEITTAEPDVVERLLANHASAVQEKDAAQIAEVVATMSGHDNPEFRSVAITALKYRASSVDKRAAKEEAKVLGLKSKKNVDALLWNREASVQEAAAYVLANHPDDKAVIGALGKAFTDRSVLKDKPRVLAAVIRAFGHLDHHKVEDDVLKLLEKANDREVARSCVRYFGQVDTKDYKIVRKLCERLEAPQPGAVDDPNNPPGEFWAALWDQWSWTRRDVTWTLKKITGQVFQPAEGEHPSDARKALEYVKEHKDELGLK